MTFRLYNGNSWIFCREILHTTAFPRENRRFCATGTALALLTHAASQRDGWYGLYRPTTAQREEDETEHETERKSGVEGKSGAVRGDLGCRRTINKTQRGTNTYVTPQ